VIDDDDVDDDDLKWRRF